MGFFPHWGSHRSVGGRDQNQIQNITSMSHPVFLTDAAPHFYQRSLTSAGKPVPSASLHCTFGEAPLVLLGHHHSSSVRIHYLVLVDSPVHPLSEPALLSSASSWSSLFSICNSVPELSWVQWNCFLLRPGLALLNILSFLSQAHLHCLPFCSALTRFLKSSLLIFISLLGTQKKIGNKVCAFDLVAFLS